MAIRLLAVAVWTACLAAAQGPLRFEVREIERKAGGCVIRLEYPVVLSAGSPAVRDAINAGVVRMLLRRTEWPASDSGARSVDEYTASFLRECREAQTGPIQRELYERKLVSVFRYTPPILSFRGEADADGGGVHPYGTTLFLNFDMTTGRTLGIRDLLKEGALAELESIAEATFRREHGVSPQAKLSEHSYSFPDDRFQLNNNFGVGERSLVFFFNTYEIGPGAMGATEIEIRPQEIQKLLRPGLRFW